MCNIQTSERNGGKILQISWRGRNLIKANVKVILMVAQFLWSPWDLLRSSNVLWTINFAINTLFLVEITVL